jgi:hypothetical protein
MVSQEHTFTVNFNICKVTNKQFGSNSRTDSAMEGMCTLVEHPYQILLKTECGHGNSFGSQIQTLILLNKCCWKRWLPVLYVNFFLWSLVLQASPYSIHEADSSDRKSNIIYSSTESHCHVVNIPASYLGSTKCKSLPRNQLLWWRFSMYFHSPFRQIPAQYPKTCHDCFLPCPFQFINHATIWHDIIWATENVNFTTFVLILNCSLPLQYHSWAAVRAPKTYAFRNTGPAYGKRLQV